MSAYYLSARSLSRLEGVHPALVAVVKYAILITPRDFCVVEGLLTTAKQREYYQKGLSRTMNSRHLTGHAVDLLPYRPGGYGDLDSPEALAAFRRIAKAMKQAAARVRVPIEWGYDLWKWDMPHFQLSAKKYPAA